MHAQAWSDGRLERSAWFGTPDHLVSDGRLFLRVQSLRSAAVLVTCVGRPEWNAETIMRYRAEHPKLEGLWPDPSRSDGGVRWIRK